MVTFVCQVCNATLRKNQVNRHCEGQCPNAWTFECIDCGKAFHGFEFQSHNSCKTEAEKYHGKYAKVKPPQTKPLQPWKGWKHTIKAALKAAGKAGVELNQLEATVLGLYFQSEPDVASEDAKEVFEAKVKYRKFVHRKGRVYFHTLARK